MVLVVLHKVEQVFCQSLLHLQFLQLLRIFRAGGQIGLPIGAEVDDVMPLLETDHLLRDGVDVTIQVSDTFIDVFGGIGQDAFLVIHRVVVIDLDQHVQHISGPSR